MYVNSQFKTRIQTNNSINADNNCLLSGMTLNTFCTKFSNKHFLK